MARVGGDARSRPSRARRVRGARTSRAVRGAARDRRRPTARGPLRARTHTECAVVSGEGYGRYGGECEIKRHCSYKQLHFFQPQPGDARDDRSMRAHSPAAGPYTRARVVPRALGVDRVGEIPGG